MAKDVLEVLDAAWSDLHTTPTCRRPEVTAQLLDARNAVAKLIAADVEYDEAKDEFRRLDAQVRFHGTDEWRNASIRLMHASSRRQAALAACRGLA